jgi:hypothetical protein
MSYRDITPAGPIVTKTKRVLQRFQARMVLTNSYIRSWLGGEVTSLPMFLFRTLRRVSFSLIFRKQCGPAEWPVYGGIWRT